MKRRPQHIINLKDDNVYSTFHAVLAEKNCPEEGIKEAWEVIKSDQSGEYNINTRTLTDPEFAHVATNLFRSMGGQSVLRQEHKPLPPGELAVEFEHRRFEPDKVYLWVRSGPSHTQ